MDTAPAASSEQKPPPSSRQRLSLRKRVFFSFVVLILLLGTVEIGLRVFMAFRVGPGVLLFGIIDQRETVTGRRVLDDDNHSVMTHENRMEDYDKYFPYQARVDHDQLTGEVFTVGINGHGFRGEDWQIEKGDGVTRVVALGASSTFGYSNRDEETYPVKLQAELTRRFGGERTFEVINLGIPHLTADQIRSLFVNEGLALEPDIVTFYEAINDSKGRVQWTAPETMSPRWIVRKIRAQMQKRLLVFALLHYGGTSQFSTYSKADVEQHAAGKPEAFVAELKRLREECASRGIVFVASTQLAKSYAVPREEIKGVAYDDEIALLEQRLRDGGTVNGDEKYFLTHGRITTRVREWAEAAGVPLVDVLAQYTNRRDVLVSWVHLTPEGNDMVAKAFADAVEAVLREPGKEEAEDRDR